MGYHYASVLQTIECAALAFDLVIAVGLLVIGLSLMIKGSGRREG